MIEALLISGVLLSLSQPLFAADTNTVTNQTSRSTEVKSDPSKATKQALTPKEALDRLVEGNTRFAKDKSVCLDRNQTRRSATVEKQRPFAIILGCSDSRVPPEIAFDQGIGDIFVVRVAGNVVSDIELASIEYSALVNDSAIVLVLGHQNCGAVEAVVQKQTEGFEAITKLIEPAIRIAKQKAGFDLKKGIEANVLNSVRRVKASPAIQHLIEEKKIDVVGGYYNLDTGKVELLNPPT